MKKLNILQKLVRATFLPALATTVALSGLLLSHSTSAAERPAFRLQVSPTYEDAGTLYPGAIYHGEFSVQNTGTNDFDYETQIGPYSVQGSHYDADLETSNKYTEMMDWVTITEGATGHLPAGSQAVVKFTIEVPENAPAGAQSAAISAKLMPDALDPGANGLQTIGQVAYFFFGNITGETKTTAEVLENKVPGFVFNPPIVATSVVKNTGNVYTYARYELEVREFFGNKLAYTNVIQDKNGDNVYVGEVVFPETERYNEVSWDGAPQLGLFKVRQVIRIFDEVSDVTKVVFLCPMWFLVLILIFVGVAVFWLVSRITHRNK